MTDRAPATPATLAALADLPGLEQASVFEVTTGTVHVTVGAPTGPPASLLAWARHARDVSGQRGRALEDVIVTTTEAHHLLRELSTSPREVLWVHVQVDGRRGNLALARRRLAQVTAHPDRSPASGSWPAVAPPRALPRSAPASPTAPTAPVALAATVTAPPAAAPAVPAPRTPALAMLPRLDESWSPARPARRGPAVPEPAREPAREPAPEPVVLEAVEPAAGAPVAPRARAPRRVPLMGRPPIAFVEPPTVPPPPLPGEPDVVEEQAGTDDSADSADSADAAGAVPDAPEAAGAVAALVTTPEGGPVLPELPTRIPGEHGPPVPAPRARERPSSWGTDGGTLRRLLVGLRRLA